VQLGVGQRCIQRAALDDVSELLVIDAEPVTATTARAPLPSVSAIAAPSIRRPSPPVAGIRAVSSSIADGRAPGIAANLARPVLVSWQKK